MTTDQWPIRDAILAHLDELLDASSFADYGPNGLQVPGAEEVTTVATGVSAGLELFERAAAQGAELVLVPPRSVLGPRGRGRGQVPHADHGRAARRCCSSAT